MIFNEVAQQLYNFEDKERTLNNFIQYMLCKTQSLFKYSGLPDTIPQKYIELYAQYNGFGIFAEHNGNLYVFRGALSDIPNEYYFPTKVVVANPYLQLNTNFSVGKDCVLLPNDSMFMGLTPIFRKYGTLLLENEITMMMSDINSRMPSIITADTDITKKSADKYLDDVKLGKLGIILSKSLDESLKTKPYAPTNGNAVITPLIELHQYYKASMYQEIGLNSNYNMKREALNSAESELNEDILKPFIDDMISVRIDAINKVNTMFGTHITVELNSAWVDEEPEEIKEEPAIEPAEAEEGANDENK